MARIFTYSFEDTTVTISHPSIGSYSAFGSGLGTISIQMADNVADHNVSTDLSVVVSKHAYRNGQVNINVLQASDFNAWLKKFARILESRPASEFALATITISNKSTKDNYVCSGVCHQKRPDDNFESSASTIGWTFLAADIASSAN